MSEEPFPLGVADAHEGIGCIARFDGGVETIRLADGTTLWTNAAALQPLAIASGRVLVRMNHPQPNVLALAVLDARDGSQRAAENVTLPFGVDPFRHDFSLRVTTTETAFVVHWQQERSYGGGAAPTESVLMDLGVGKVEDGVIRLELDSANPSVPAAPVDFVYSLTPNHALEARDATTGALQWRRELPSPPELEAPPLPM